MSDPVYCAGCGQNPVAPKYGTGLCRTCLEVNFEPEKGNGSYARRGSQAKRSKAAFLSTQTDVSDKLVTREAIKGALALGELTEEEALELWLESC
jgi:hypothetical protein